MYWTREFRIAFKIGGPHAHVADALYSLARVYRGEGLAAMGQWSGDIDMRRFALHGTPRPRLWVMGLVQHLRTW